MLLRNQLRHFAFRAAVLAPLVAFTAPVSGADDAPKSDTAKAEAKADEAKSDAEKSSADKSDDDAAPEPAAIFKQLDKNGDGKIEKDEVPENQRRFFERVLRTGDKDDSGSLTVEEFVAGSKDTERRDAAGPGFGGGGRPNPGEMFERMDTNKDGKIQKSEVPEPALRFIGPIFERAGKDELTKADFEEFGRQMMRERGGPGGGPGGGQGGPMGDPGQMFDRMDANQDGKLAKDEVPEPAKRFLGPLFERLGKDEITKAEFEEAGRRMREAGGRPGDGGRPNPEEMKARGEEMFKRLDKNSDGKLTLDEAPEEGKARLEAMFERLGKGKDGSVSKDEFLESMGRMMGGRGPGGGRGPEGRGPEGRRPDGPPRDGEGRGPDGRGPEGRRPDGPPGEGEGRGPEGRGPEGRGPGGPGFGGPPRMPPNLARFDKNEDGKLSKRELERLMDQFDDLDRNEDGSLDMPELLGFPPFGGPGGPGMRGPGGPGGPEGRGPQGDRRPDGPPRGPEGGRRPEGDRPPRDVERPSGDEDRRPRRPPTEDDDRK
jgi:Ca2+-binding EF-hand superfamily protein